jgi:hypothetical protein
MTTTKIDALIAPRALTAIDLTSVTIPHLIAYAVTHRAFIFAGVLQDDANHEVATVHACEGALQGIVDDAMSSVNQWLADMESDGTPRFYRKASVKDAVERLCRQAAAFACRAETPAELNQLLTELTDREPGRIHSLIALAGE